MTTEYDSKANSSNSFCLNPLAYQDKKQFIYKSNTSNNIENIPSSNESIPNLATLVTANAMPIFKTDNNAIESKSNPEQTVSQQTPDKSEQTQYTTEDILDPMDQLEQSILELEQPTIPPRQLQFSNNHNSRLTSLQELGKKRQKHLNFTWKTLAGISFLALDTAILLFIIFYFN